MSYRDFIELCQEQNGFITSAQARRIGLNNADLRRLVARGELRWMHRGVYRHEVIPSSLRLNEEVQAAWLSLYPEMTMFERRCNPQMGVLRAETAAYVQNLGDLKIRRFSFYVPGRKTSTAQDMDLRRAELTPDEIVMVQGMPVTTPTRTIIDLLAENREPEHVNEAIRDAGRHGLELDHDAIRATFPAYSQRSGLTVENIEDTVYGLKSLERILADRVA